MKKLIITTLILFSLAPCFAQFSDSSELIIKMRRDYKHMMFIDIDQDGDDDILAGVGEEIEILKNDGSGNFSPSQHFLNVGGYLSTFDVQDVNSDGMLDLIVLHHNTSVTPSKAEIWGNIGNSNFILETSFSAPTGAKSNPFAYVDLNNDGLKDLVISGGTNSNTQIFTYTSGFNFTPNGTLAISRGVIVGDVNNDGWQDILGGFGHQFKVALNDGIGGFPTLSNGYIAYPSNNQPEIQLVDYNGDNNLDVVMLINESNHIYLFSNDGTGDFSLDQSILTNDSYVSNLTKRDLNSDGIMDIAWKTNVNNFLYPTREVNAMFGNGTGFGTVQTINNKISGIPSMCFSNSIGNGVDNLLLYGGNDRLKQFLHLGKTGPGIYDNERYLDTNYTEPNTNMMTADFNGDGLIDFAAPPLFHYNQGNGIFTQHFDSTLLVAGGYKVEILNHGDFNNDGIEDLVGIRDLPNSNFGLVYFLGLTTGGYGTYNPIANDFIENLKVHDINGDGWLDMYYTYHSSFNPKIFFVINTGGTGFSKYEFMGNWNNNNLSYYDEFIDYTLPKKDTISNNINLAYIINEQISVKLNDGSAPQDIGVSANRLEIKDMDGDGYSDIFYVRYNNGLGWVKNEGNNVFSDQGIFYPVNSPSKPIFKDLDNDSDFDIIVQDQNSSSLYFLENIGFGDFAPPIVLATDSKPAQGNGWIYQYAEDLDNDGDLDITYMKKPQYNAPQRNGDMYTLYNQLVGINEISGFVYNDQNQDQIWNIGENTMSNIPVSLSSFATNYSGQNGDFLFSPSNDTYNLGVSLPQYWSLTTSASNYSATVSAQNPIVDSIYFGIIADTLMYNSEPELVGGFPRCNSEANFWFSVKNTGTLAGSGILELILDDSITFSSALITPDSIVGDSYFWSYDSLDLFSYKGIDITIFYPDFQSMGDTLTSVLINHITDSTGIIIKTSADTLNQVLVCGYDPNDKSVYPNGLTDEGFITVNDSILEYLVRFQNTGNDTVFNARIIDQIHPNLDISTFKVLGFSHPMTTNIINNGKLEFMFNDILLPDSNVNFLGSQGYVKYRIETMPGLTVGDQFLNKASIYFDYNPPIHTNITKNTIFDCNNLIDSIIGNISPSCISEGVSLIAFSNLGENYEWKLNGNSISISDTLEYIVTGLNETLSLNVSNTFCTLDTTWTIQVSQTPSPNLMLADTLDLCQGENLLLQSNYSSGNSWFFNGQASQNTPTLNASQNGEYVLKVQDGLCSNTDTVFLNFNPIPVPNLNLQDSLIICETDSISLSSNLSTGNEWYFDGNLISTDSSVWVNQEGSYYIQTNNGYCSNFGEDSIHITVQNLANANISSSNGLGFCYGDSTVLSSNQPTFNMWFLDGALLSYDSAIVVSQQGTYKLSVSNFYCQVFSDDYIQLSIHPIPNSHIENTDNFTLSSIETHDEYLWLDCNNSFLPILGENGPTFTPSANGSYALKATNEFGCTDTSNCLSIVHLDVNENEIINEISIRPNPVKNTFYINGLNKTTDIMLTDATGKVILNTSTSHEVDVSGIAPGTYFVSFIFENRQIVKRIIIGN